MHTKWVPLLFGFWAFGLLQSGNCQTSIFPAPGSFPAYQSTSYEPLQQSLLPGDFNGDGIVDFAYLETSAGSDEFLVVVFGKSNGVPQQVGTDLKGCSASTMAAADVNQDGHLDVVILCAQGFTETLLGNGDGTFQSPLLSTQPSGTFSLAVADFNGDKLPDIAYALNNGNGYAISLNNGGGQFAAPITYPLTFGNPIGIAAGDFNGDGKRDLVFGTGYVLGKGDGTFGSEQPLPSGIGQFAVGNFSSDGYTDLAFTLSPTAGTSQSSSIQLIAGSSSGLVSQPTAISGNGFLGASLQAAALTASGNLDLVAINSGEPSVLLGNGNESFDTSFSYGNQTQVFADMNADGALDLVSIGSGSSFSVVYGNGNGTFQGWPMTITPGSAVATADFNGDGLPDEVVKSSPPNGPQVYLSTGNGRFTPAPQSSTVSSGDFGTIFVTGDFNRDGKQDIVSISPGCPIATKCGDGPEYAQMLVYLGNGDGTLNFSGQANLGVDGAEEAVVGDFNGDGNLDLVVVYLDQYTLLGGAVFVPGNGDGTFGAPVQIPLLGSKPLAVTAADLTGNNNLDLVIVDSSGTVVTYLGNGNGTFTPDQQILQFPADGSIPVSPVLADVTGDGVPDLVCVVSSSLNVYAGEGDGTFNSSPVDSAPIPNFASSPIVQVGNLTGGVLPDIAVGYTTIDAGQALAFFLAAIPNTATESNQLVALTRLNENSVPSGNDAYLDALSQSPLNSGAWGLVSLLNQDNSNPSPGSATTLSLVNSSGPSVTVGQTITVDASVSAAAGASTSATGTVTFSVNRKVSTACTLTQSQCSVSILISQVGSITIEAVYGGDATHAGTEAFLTITASSVVTTTTLIASSTNIPPGVGVTFTADVVPSTATGTVTFNDGATALGTGTLSAGVATFTTSSLSTGTHSITASYSGDANDAPSTSASTSIVVSAPAATTTTLSVSSTGVAQGVSVTLTASVGPSTATGTVTFNDGSTLLGTGTLSDGVATFTTNALSVGTHPVTASYEGDAGDAPSTSATVDIVVAAPSLQLAANPSSLSITQGASGSTNVSVTPVGSYGGTLTFTCSGLPQYATCTFAPSNLTFAGGSNQAAQSTTLTIATNVAAQSALHSNRIAEFPGARRPHWTSRTFVVPRLHPGRLITPP